MSDAAIRPATAADDAALLALDAATWSAFASPAPPPPPEVPFFDRGIAPEDVLVADADGAVVGYAAIGPYEACGFVVEGVLREEFLLDGAYVDDVPMARDLTNTEGDR